MPTLVSQFVNTDRFNTPDDSVRAVPIPEDRPGWVSPYSTGSVAVEAPMTPHAAPFRAPSRIYTLPDPAVGGYAEWQASVGRTVDPGFSTHNRQAFAGQGHYDSIPQRYADPLVTGVGTPNTHGKYLRQGLLTQIAGYNPPTAVNNIGYVAALSRGSTNLGVSENGLRL